MSRGTTKRTSTLLSPSGAVNVARTSRRCLIPPRLSTIFTASVSSSSLARCSSRCFCMIAVAVGAWAAAWPARTPSSMPTSASAVTRFVMLSRLEEVLQEHEHAVVAAIPSPVAVGLAGGEEVEAAFDLEGVADPVRDLRLHVGVGGAVEVQHGRQLHLGVLAQLDERAADEGLAKDATRDQVAQPRHAVERQQVGVAPRVQDDLARIFGEEDDVLHAGQGRVPRVVEAGDALPAVLGAVG